MSELQFYERRTMGRLSRAQAEDQGGAQPVDERVGGLEGDVGLLAQVHPLFVTVGE